MPAIKRSIKKHSRRVSKKHSKKKSKKTGSKKHKLSGGAKRMSKRRISRKNKRSSKKTSKRRQKGGNPPKYAIPDVPVGRERSGPIISKETPVMKEARDVAGAIKMVSDVNASAQKGKKRITKLTGMANQDHSHMREHPLTYDVEWEEVNEGGKVVNKGKASLVEDYNDKTLSGHHNNTVKFTEQELIDAKKFLNDPKNLRY